MLDFTSVFLIPNLRKMSHQQHDIKEFLGPRSNIRNKRDYSVSTHEEILPFATREASYFAVNMLLMIALAIMEVTVIILSAILGIMAALSGG